MSAVCKLTFYVPASHVESVKEAVFAAGGGQLGDYVRCAWQVLGEGQFQPLDSASPYLGTSGELTRVPEYRVEMLVPASRLPAVVAALRLAHPYETPAYDVIALQDV